MGNAVGVFTTRATVGPLPFGPDPGDSVLIALLAERGPSDVPTLVTSFDAFKARFGGATPFASATRFSAGYEVLDRLFAKGRTGKRVYVLRIVGANAEVAHVDLADRDGTPEDTVRVSAKGEGTWANDHYLVVANGTKTNTWKLSIYDGDPAAGGVLLETWDNLLVTDASLATVTSGSLYVDLTNLNSSTAAPNNRPATGTFQLDADNAGVDDNAPAEAVIVGTASNGVKTGLKAFRDSRYGRGFALAPDLDAEDDPRTELIEMGEAFYRMVLIGSTAGDTPSDAITDVATAQAFNALYHYPRGIVEDALTGEYKAIPLSGHIIADWLTAIAEQGPGKAPAGRAFKADRIVALESQANGMPLVDATVAELLLGSGINPIWDRDGHGPRCWGGRSTDDDVAWQYAHAGYLWCLIASRVQEALDILVYDQANPALFAQIRTGVRAFLVDLHAQGAFTGTVPNENEEENPEVHAFSVKCDESLLTAQDRNNGIVRVKLWYRPVGVAESIYVEVAKRNEG